MWWYALTRGMVVPVASVKFEGSVPLVLRTGVFLFLPLNWGRVVGRPEWPWVYGPLPVGTDVCEKGGELIRPNYTGKFAVLGNINSLVLTYAPGVSVFPARSGFTPGWVYVHVGGGTHCCCRVLFLTVCSCILHCTAIVHRETLVTPPPIRCNAAFFQVCWLPVAP